MRCSGKLRVIAILVSWALGLAIGCVSAQVRPTVEQFFKELQSKQKSDQAAAQLLKMGRSDAEARHFLVLHLPALIDVDPRPTRAQYQKGLVTSDLNPIWLSAVQLAAELGIVEAAPAMAKWITVSDSDGLSFGSGEESIGHSPAARALVEIGDPSVPSLRPLLYRHDPNERNHAVEALLAIDSPTADAVLRDYVANGRDRGLAELIRNRLKIRANH